MPKTLKDCLLPQKRISVRSDLAVAVGLNEAIILQQLIWLLENEANGKSIDGHRWIFNTYDQWQTQYFPFWSSDTIKRTLKNLERHGVVKSCQPEKVYSRRKYYRVEWAAFDKALDHQGRLPRCNRADCPLPITEVSSKGMTSSKEEETRIPELSLSNAVKGEEVSIPKASPEGTNPNPNDTSGRATRAEKKRDPSAMFQNETIHQDARGLTGKARALRDDLNEAEASAWAASLVLGVPLSSFRPQRHQFDAFVDEYCPKIQKNRPDLFDELCEKDWKDGRDRPIGNWKSYVLGLEEKMPY